METTIPVGASVAPVEVQGEHLRRATSETDEARLRNYMLSQKAQRAEQQVQGNQADPATQRESIETDDTEKKVIAACDRILHLLSCAESELAAVQETLLDDSVLNHYVYETLTSELPALTPLFQVTANSTENEAIFAAQETMARLLFGETNTGNFDAEHAFLIGGTMQRLMYTCGVADKLLLLAAVGLWRRHKDSEKWQSHFTH